MAALYGRSERGSERRRVLSLLPKQSFEEELWVIFEMTQFTLFVTSHFTLLKNENHADRCQSRIFSPRRQSQHIPQLAILEHMTATLADLTNLPRLQPFTCSPKCKCNSGFLQYIIPAAFTLLAIMSGLTN